MKKNKFLTFLFALLPGAGHMYLGMMKKGCTFMGLFFAVICIASFLRMDFLLFILPIIFFYSFFDTYNYTGMEREERVAADRQFNLTQGGFTGEKIKEFIRKRHVFLGIILIVIALYMILNTIVEPLLIQYFFSFNEQYVDFYYAYVATFLRSLPNIIVCILIIYVGMRLIRGKKADQGADDELQNFTGQSEEDNGGDQRGR